MDRLIGRHTGEGVCRDRAHRTAIHRDILNLISLGCRRNAECSVGAAGHINLAFG